MPSARLGRVGLTTVLATCCLIFIFFTFTLFDGQHVEQLLTIPSRSNVEVVTPDNDETFPYRTFRSSPWQPPNISITTSGAELGEGYLFLNPKDRGRKGVKQTAPYVFEPSTGELVFAATVDSNWTTTDFAAQSYLGKQYLTFWQGKSTGSPNPGHGYGEVVFLSDDYSSFTLELDAVIVGLEDVDTKKHPGMPPGKIDIHEHQMTDRDTLLVTAYNNTPANLSSVDGPEDGWVADSLFFEIDVATQEVVFQWSPLEHIPLNASRMPVRSYMGNGTKAAPWDFFHTNSIQAVGEDYYLISSRHTWSVYLIHQSTGEVVCHFNGEDGGDFGAVPDGGTFKWQHHARAHDVTTTEFYLSLFDNHAMAEDAESGDSGGLLFRVPLPPQSREPVELIRRFEVPDEGLRAPSQGSFQAKLDPADTYLVGYGQVPVAREFGADGELRWEARYGYHDWVQSFRAFKEVWRATPKDWDPSLVIEAEDDGQRVRAYVSWNGATEVRAWDVFEVSRGGHDDERRRPAGKEDEEEEVVEGRYRGHTVKTGFETTFSLQLDEDACLQVAAVQNGVASRRSNIACLP